MSTTPDGIEKKIMLRAPRQRVWEAISDARKFGSWFGVEFDGPFVPDRHMTGKIVPTTVDEEVARSQKPYEGKSFNITVDRIVPMKLFSFRWHPYAVDADADYSKEPTTVVVFELEEVAGGSMLTITESGFSQIPLERRAKAFAGNEEGWTWQTKLIEKYLARAN
jgi:uncharacterized protein YndB with AHSA1/START domain